MTEVAKHNKRDFGCHLELCNHSTKKMNSAFLHYYLTISPLSSNLYIPYKGAIKPNIILLTSLYIINK